MTTSPYPARGVPPAPSLTDDVEDVALDLAPFFLWTLILLGSAAALFLVLILQPAWLAPWQATIAGLQPTAYWYLSRSSALVSFGMVWISMVTGLVITNKLARVWPGGPTYVALHEHTSWLGVVFAAFHALVLLGDSYIGYTFTQLLIPFGNADYRPLWVALGQFGFYGLVLVTVTFYLRRLIGQRLFRVIHYLSFGVFALALAHGVFSGTDTSVPLVTGMYWAGGLSVVLLTWRRMRLGLGRKSAEAVEAGTD